MTEIDGSHHVSTRESPGPRLREASPDDIEAITTVWHSGWPEGHLGHVPEALLMHRRLEDFRARVPSLLDRTTVATIGPELAGFVMVHDDEIEQIYVAESARGSGVAPALLRHAERAIGDRFDLAWLAVVAGNTRARRFYARNCWRDAGLFEHEAPIEGGSIPLAAHRYEKRIFPKP
jgi:ribosomal protein S18 acetylase RimI-like enzyme